MIAKTITTTDYQKFFYCKNNQILKTTATIAQRSKTIAMTNLVITPSNFPFSISIETIYLIIIKFNTTSDYQNLQLISNFSFNFLRSQTNKEVQNLKVNVTIITSAIIIIKS